MSIENARFLEERQREIDMLQSLRELAVWLISADDTRSVGHEILETAVQLLEGQNAVLYEYEQENSQLRTLVKLWFSETRSVTAEETLPYRVAQEAAQSGEVVMITDVSRHHAYSAVSYFNYRSIVANPLQHARQVRYIILITFEEMRRLMERDLNTIDLLGGQAVGHLENAQLHARIRAGRDQMRAILDSTQDGMILLDRKANLIETNPSAHRLLGVNLEVYIGQSYPRTLLKQRENGIEIGYTSADIEGLVRTLHTNPDQETHHDIRRVKESQVIYIEEIGLPVRDEL
jgi:PAS domain-containing protein